MVVSTTLCYPNPAAPTQGIFVARRLREMARRVPLAVVAPVPWFPIVRPISFDLRHGAHSTPPVRHPRMFYLPGVAKSLDAAFYARALTAALREMPGRADIRLIDAHFEWPDAVGALYAARRLGLPIVCTLRGKLHSQAAHPRKRRRIVNMLRTAGALIAVSRALADDARRIAEADLPITVIPNGIDGSMFRHVDEAGRRAARDALGWDDGARYVVSVGHLQALKGFDRLVEVWPAVRSRIGDARLVLVGGPAGEPSFERRLRGRIEALNLRSSVTLAGRREPADVAKMLQAADLFALASRSEGWCNALAEALACGCPAVATDVGGNREIILDASLGRLVPPDDGEMLSTALIDALTTPWDRPRIATAGGRRSWQQVAAECVDVFISVCPQIAESVID